MINPIVTKYRDINEIKSLDAIGLARLKEWMLSSTEVFAYIMFDDLIEMPDKHQEFYSEVDNVFNPLNPLKSVTELSYRSSGKTTKKRTILLKNAAYNLTQYVVNIHSIFDNAKNDIDALKEDIASDKFAYLFGERKFSVDNSSRLMTADGKLNVVARGYSSHMKGLLWRKKRPGLILIDDVESEVNTASNVSLNNFVTTFFSNLIYIGDKDSMYFILNTVVFENGIMANIQNPRKRPELFRSPIGKVISMPVSSRAPAYEEWVFNEDGDLISTIDLGELTFAALHDRQFIVSRGSTAAKQGRIAYTEFLRAYYNIVSKSKDKVDLSKIGLSESYVLKHYTTVNSGRKTTYHYLDNGTSKIPVNPIHSIDQAYRTKKSNDYTAAVTVCIDANDMIYIVDKSVVKMRSIERFNYFITKASSHLCNVLIETLDNGGIVMSEFVEATLNAQYHKGVLPVKLRVLSAYDKIAKEDRHAEWLTPYINLNKIIFLNKADKERFISEYSGETSGEEHDDYRDAVSQAIAYLKRNPVNLKIDIDNMIKADKLAGSIRPGRNKDLDNIRRYL